ncbi:protein atonal homolog 7 isoform X4 [Eurytemora carolleeae]|uniref:protein atonal homolog 7 isoform X4 n=1 Tax=Eurytemora carolleeae TaxID=1294199 RepID=UPI000C7827D4|nr:protein atonal homolog 7 isoform X4 [Eurytemora carolleeae]|eukprot:XP_023349438.1 protein atonal homolog 7-like isoform X4 [Eurytemora affinis]
MNSQTYKNGFEKETKRKIANEKERLRMIKVNAAYDKLNNLIYKRCDKKYSKVKILQATIAYIATLQTILGTDTLMQEREENNIHDEDENILNL